MKPLNDLASGIGRFGVSNMTGSLSPSSVTQALGMSSTVSNVDRVLSQVMPEHSANQRTADLYQPIPSAVEPSSSQQSQSKTESWLGASPAWQSSNTANKVLRPTQQYADWQNPFVSHAMPALLCLRRYLSNRQNNQTGFRAQLALEVRLFRERLSKSGCEWELLNEASYLLCTYLDETVGDIARQMQQTPYDGDRSLLVEFHGDAWGGENVFLNLEKWMHDARPPIDLLLLYEMILALGFYGRYHLNERGDVLLQDLRSQLHAKIWQNRVPAALGLEQKAGPMIRKRWWTAGKATASVLAVGLLAYLIASFDLDSRGRPIRQALAAWTPPVSTINMAETLPQPIPDLVSEGWLSAYKHPDGWLLVFRSDGAFDVGQAQFRREFMHNIERLGLAFANKPGDLEVIGHTDAQPIKGRFSNNQQLSEARAQVVANELRQTAQAGGSHAPIDAVTREINFSGRGDTDPVDTAKNQAAYERNRRVDVLWKVNPHTQLPKDVAIPASVRQEQKL